MIRTVQAICWPAVLSLNPAGALLSEEINQMIIFTRGHVYKRSRTLRDLGRSSDLGVHYKQAMLTNVYT